MAAVCRADPSLVEAMTVEDPRRAPQAGQAVGVPAAAGTAAHGAVQCRVIWGTGA
jgi:hypothetical protein